MTEHRSLRRLAGAAALAGVDLVAGKRGLALAVVLAGAGTVYVIAGNLAPALAVVLLGGMSYALAAAVAERRRVEATLRASEERYALAAGGAKDGLWDWDLRTGRVDFSPRWKAMLGYREDEIGSDPDEWLGRVHDEDRGPLRLRLEAHLDGATADFEGEYRIRRRDGAWRWMLARGLAVRDAAGKAYRIAGSQSDIAARKQAEEKLAHEAFHDPLTGLPNRALFLDRLGRSFERTRRQPRYHFAVLFADLDRFKLINDSLGHPIGDRLLIEVARRLESSIRPGDTVARIGGDEFAILLEDLREVADATRIAERVLAETSTPVHLGSYEAHAAMSVGIAWSAAGYKQPEDLLRDADTAMYWAKDRGRGRYQVFDAAMHRSAVARLALETELRRAVSRGELRVAYQPILSLSGGRVRGFEALLRWRHPVRGVLPAAEFLAVAEETGLLLPIGLSLLDGTCRQLREWQKLHPSTPPLKVDVNLSRRQLLQPGLVEEVSEILEDSGLEARSLAFEVTEALLLAGDDAALPALSGLRDLGCELVIDDFGTGYSSLAHLHRLPLGALKVDRSFVSEIGARSGGLEIVSTIVALARSLGIRAMAEGVETAEQLAALRALGCDEVQGFHVAPPLDAAAAGALLGAGLRW